VAQHNSQQHKDYCFQQPKRANTLYSAAKYPAAKTPNNQLKILQNNKVKVNYQVEPHSEATGNLRVLDQADTFVKLYEAGVVRSDNNSDLGLGPLPNTIKSISNLLLFNSSQNPYKKYSSLDNLDGSRKILNEQDQKEELFSAPQTIIDGSILVNSLIS
jgi:WAS family protein 1